ncbi:hypothetical protein PSE_p0140 (plasmid) [Pseudovibrio sp. FO-BEG1]|nr:hypothetical protein PSE_p0140 [Pseudovibrio sp. FO-BEG1]
MVNHFARTLVLHKHGVFLCLVVRAPIAQPTRETVVMPQLTFLDLNGQHHTGAKSGFFRIGCTKTL